MQYINRFRSCKPKIGLLGRSFDPPHYGHLSISNYTVKMLNLNYAMCLVAPPQNPFKQKHYLSINQRANLALDFAYNPEILVSTIESELQYKYSYQILQLLTSHFTQIKFT